MKRVTLFAALFILLLFNLPTLTLADADPKAEAILDDISDARHPEGLSGFICYAEMKTRVEGDPSGSMGFLALLELPVIGMDITYVAPFDFRVEITNSPVSGMDILSSTRLRGDDPVMLSNPALKQALLAVYDIEYVGMDEHNGTECHVLHFTPIEETNFRPPFGLYIRESDDVPIYTEMILTHNDENILFRSEIEYTTIDGFMLPDVIETRADFLDGTELVMTTTFSDYEVNTFSRTFVGKEASDNGEDGDDDIDKFFSDIYHGFEDPVMMVDLGADSEPYSKLRFAFALEVPSKAVAKELELKHPEIVALTRDALSGRSWATLEDQRFETGRELMKMINDILTEGDVTDFYFTVFIPER